MKKEERKKLAVKHHQEMMKLYKKEIEASVKASIVYETKDFSKRGQGKFPEIQVLDMPSEETVQDGYCILNFASFTKPGGGFLNGAIAQEEALCHSSNLYEVLCKFKGTFYKDNYEKYQNNGLYKDRAIYSPGIIFGGEKRASVITCAAPNIKRYGERNNTSLRSRCKFILDIAEENQEKILILGAFGCGVFGNNPFEVAKIFKELLETKEYNFEKIIFAIPYSMENLKAFNEEFVTH